MEAAVVWFVLGLSTGAVGTISTNVLAPHDTEKGCLAAAARLLRKYPETNFLCVKGVTDKATLKVRREIDKALDKALDSE
jgi:hypothetical protein